MIFNWIFSESFKSIPEEIDYIFITSYFNHDNMTQVQIQLHHELEELNSLQSSKDICFLELNKKSSLTKTFISVNYPSIQFQGITGMLIPIDSLRGMKRILHTSHYLNSFDLLAQHYCEIEKKQILLSPLFSFLPSDI